MVLASTGSNQNDYEIGICCFSANHRVLRRNSKDCLARNQDNVSEWSDMSTHGQLFQWVSTIKIQLRELAYYTADIIIISLNKTCSRHDIAEKHLVLNANHSITINYTKLIQNLVYLDMLTLYKLKFYSSSAFSLFQDSDTYRYFSYWTY